MSEQTSEPICVICKCACKPGEKCTHRRWNGYLCAKHAGRILSHLRDLLTHSRTINAMTGHSTAVAGQRVSGSSDDPLPGGTWLGIAGPAAADTIHRDDTLGTGDPEDYPEDDHPTVLDVLGSWVRSCAEDLNVTMPLLPHNLDGIATATAFLARHHGWICEQAWVDEYAAELESTWAHTRSAANASPARRKSRIPCAVCGMRETLVQPDSLEPYRCLPTLGGCNAQETEDDHENRLKAIEEQAMGLGVVSDDGERIAS